MSYTIQFSQAANMRTLLMTLALAVSWPTHALDVEADKSLKQVTRKLKISCPAENFSLFIQKFSDDETIQRTFTKYPLTKLDLDIKAEPEPKEFIRKLHREQIQFPLMPLSQERTKLSLEIRIENVTAVNAQIKLIKPDTDYQVLYFFEKKDCWRLVRIEDWSL